jgi:hypothetical protein
MRSTARHYGARRKREVAVHDRQKDDPMIDDRFAFDPEVNSLPPGTMIHGLTSNGGRSATFTVVSHEGAIILDVTGGRHRIVIPAATITRGAIYSAAIIGNGWEPHQQPSPAAYLPLRWSDLRLFMEDGGLTLCVENEAQFGSMGHFVSSEAGHEFTFVATRMVELRHVARHLSAATGAAASMVLAMLFAMTQQRAIVTPAAA